MTAQPAHRRLAPEARRELILGVAVDLFGRRPYAQVSTNDIARRAGVTRGLLHHYFGTKRDLYLEVVRRMVLLTLDHELVTPTGPLHVRVDRSVAWFLDVVSEHGQTYIRVVGAEGVADDPEVERILARADDVAARVVLATLGRGDLDDPRARAVVRAYGGLVKAAVREWLGAGTLTRQEVHRLLCRALLTVVRDVLPHLPERSSA
ncbi:MAG TPA: helix-turn-helix domain-containing protein [Mycobacteriales bacterium]